jgi:hypothetical protein
MYGLGYLSNIAIPPQQRADQSEMRVGVSVSVRVRDRLRPRIGVRTRAMLSTIRRKRR